MWREQMIKGLSQSVEAACSSIFTQSQLSGEGEKVMSIGLGLFSLSLTRDFSVNGSRKAREGNIYLQGEKVSVLVDFG